MLSIFDNIIAIMIAGVVILLLFTIQQRSTDFNLEQNIVYSSKKFSLDFAEWLEGDLSLTGTNIENGEVHFSALSYEGLNTGLRYCKAMAQMRRPWMATQKQHGLYDLDNANNMRDSNSK